MRQAPLEFARVVYGISDCAHGRLDSMAARALRHAERQGMAPTRERAEQRARAYLPVAGHEHCPRCWVFCGTKSLLQVAALQEGGGLETARCSQCGAEYLNVP